MFFYTAFCCGTGLLSPQIRIFVIVKSANRLSLYIDLLLWTLLFGETLYAVDLGHAHGGTLEIHQVVLSIGEPLRIVYHCLLDDCCDRILCLEASSGDLLRSKVSRMHLSLKLASCEAILERLHTVYRLHVALVEHFFDHALAIRTSIGGYLIADFPVLEQDIVGVARFPRHCKLLSLRWLD